MSWQTRPRCDTAPAWAELAAHHARSFRGAQAFDLRSAFAQDQRRFADFSLQAPHVFADFSKSLIDRQALALLLELARQCRLEQHRDAMLSGQCVNNTEQRPALHTLLRTPADDASLPAALADAHARCLQERQAMLDLAQALRTQQRFDDVVHMGIGGSDLGPRLALQALAPHALPGGPRMHFVANMDGHELAAALAAAQPQRTLFIVASKSFGTAETLQNAQSARAWLQAGGVPADELNAHFVALTARPEAARAFGVSHCLTFAEGVGGRYSLWSAIGLPIALALGAPGFERLLAGAHEMDEHFARAPLQANLPALLGLLDVWNRNFHGYASRCIAPYHHGLRRLPAYLQQLEMESNGKRVDAHGRALPFDTAPVVWGEAGSNGQHAFFQMLHQGTQVIPVDFIAARQPAHTLAGHHAKLLTNALAQSRALMLGQQGSDGHRHFPGNRPSLFLLLERLDAASFGALIALHEHRVFVSGSLWGLNSFDQWGVELGKRHAGDIEACLLQGHAQGMDASTAGLLARLCENA
ncbi:MAG: glucose-6-phosphate isomerase [Ottowia sp.]